MRHGVNQVPPRFELGSLDSKSRVLTITPWNLAYVCRVKNKVSKLDKVRKLQNFCFLPGSNRRPCACEAHVITTTLWKLACLSPSCLSKIVVFKMKKIALTSGTHLSRRWSSPEWQVARTSAWNSTGGFSTLTGCREGVEETAWKPRIHVRLERSSMP